MGHNACKSTGGVILCVGRCCKPVRIWLARTFLIKSKFCVFSVPKGIRVLQKNLPKFNLGETGFWDLYRKL